MNQSCQSCKWFELMFSVPGKGWCMWEPDAIPDSYVSTMCNPTNCSDGESCPTYSAKEDDDDVTPIELGS